ncbi:MAG: HAMP domain-containing protein, partial [Parvularculaceae bacterium]|nr:HAMP domain-containing protein [Parvularculaceae bacterium]
MKNSEEVTQRQASAVERLKGARKLLPSWVLSNTTAATALTAAAMVAFISTWFLLSPAVEYADRSLLIALIVANFVIAAGFASLIGVRVWHVWSDRRNHLAGSRTHTQLVVLFSIVAVAPAIIAFLFAFTILRSSLNDVFGERIENYQQTARDLANGLVEIKAAELQQAMREIAYDIRRNEAAGVGLEATPISFRQYVFAQAEFRDLAAILIFDGADNLIVRAEVADRRYNLPSSANLNSLKKAGAGETVLVGVNDEKNDMFRGAIGLEDYDGGYMVVYQPIDEKTTSRLFAVSALRDDWEEAKIGRSRAERIFLAGYVLLAVIILFGAIWVGLWAATRIVQPIGRLVHMAERVSAGDLRSRVEVYKRDGELGVLARSMNHMTAQLQTQRDDLIETNRQFDLRRRFTEAVLSGVSAGVVGLSPRGRVTIANRSAGFMLGADETKMTGKSLVQLLPEAAELFEHARLAPFDVVSDQIEVERDGRKRVLNIRIVSDEVEGARSYVVTFDDISELISAQRSAA